MIIPIHYKYKNYPNAPKATAKSNALGVMTSFVAMAMWSFFFMGIIVIILSAIGLEDNTAYTIGAILIIPFVYGILKWKKHCIQKIDKAAAAEAISMLSMTPEEKALMEKEQKKKGTKIVLYLLGGIILFDVVLVVYLQLRS